MNTITYEEDLQKNPLYLKLMQKSSLLQEICINNWIFALPRKTSFSEDSLNNHEFILSHILSPSEELPKTHFINLIGNEVSINEQIIKLTNDQKHQCAILFEEFYYTKDLQKFKIMCIDMPLNIKFCKNPKLTSSTVKNVQESIELIRQNCSKQVERKINNAIRNFSLRIQKSFDYHQFHKNIKLVYDYCINVASNRKVKDDQFLFLNVKIAIEYLIMDVVYEKLFDAITVQYCEKNSEFNKILKKLSNITLNDLNLSHLPVASKIIDNINILRIELLKIGNCKSAIDKLNCVKKLCDTISCYNDDKLTATELLPILVYVFIKSNYFYFISTLIFIKEFNLSQILNTETHSVGSALVYILTTVEAIIYFIQTNENMNLEKNQMIKKAITTVDNIKCKEDYMNFIFKCIYDNDEVELEKYLNMPYTIFMKEISSSSSSESSSLQNSVSCHPLCRCPSCGNHKNNTSSSLNVNQTSHNGLRMLHVAAFYNLPKIISLLLANDAEIDATDENGLTALHMASIRGHQKVLFLLLHGNANINLFTKDKKTSLMLASMYGHEHCVKALLFFSEHTHMAINMNAQDDEGNSALHYASQCGFHIILDILLEYQAKSTLKNNFGKTPLDYAYNSVIKKKLEDAVKYQVEELPVRENEYVFIRKQDLAEIFENTK